MNLYVSNLAYSLTDEELRREFAAYGTVLSARVVLDRETGRSRGFGFVDMPNDAEAAAALSGLEGANLGGRAMRVVVARPKEERPAAGPGQRQPQRSFSGGGGGQGGGGGGFGGHSGGGGGGGGQRGGGERNKQRDWSRDKGGDRGGEKGERGGGGGRREWGGGGRAGRAGDDDFEY